MCSNKRKKVLISIAIFITLILSTVYVLGFGTGLRCRTESTSAVMWTKPRVMYGLYKGFDDKGHLFLYNNGFTEEFVIPKEIAMDILDRELGTPMIVKYRKVYSLKIITHID